MIYRFFDIIFSLAAILCLLPFLVLVSIALRFSGERKIIYAQKRVGFNGRDFRLYKFATMLENSPHIGAGTITLKDDPRILPLGKFLRRTKINELPQLFNVLLGDMSFIGPRPQDMRCFLAYPEGKRQIITKVLPGLSGIGSIVFRNEEDILSDAAEKSADVYDNLIMPYKAELEEWFVQNKSLVLYFRLILMTVQVVLAPRSLNYWQVFKNIPVPPSELQSHLRYSG